MAETASSDCITTTSTVGSVQSEVPQYEDGDIEPIEDSRKLAADKDAKKRTRKTKFK